MFAGLVSHQTFFAILVEAHSLTAYDKLPSPAQRSHQGCTNMDSSNQVARRTSASDDEVILFKPRNLEALEVS